MLRSDPLSDVLQALEARSVVSTGLRATGSWSVAVPGHVGMKFNAILSGECVLSVEGAERVTLFTGDCFLLTQGLPFTIGVENAYPRPAKEVFADARGYFAELDCGGGNEFSCIGGRMDTTVELGFLQSSLPSLILLKRGTPEAARVGWLLERLTDELSQQLPGSNAIGSQIMHMIFIEMIRASAPTAPGVSNWLAAVLDPKIGRALRLIHAEPKKLWRLAELADASNLSKSQFSSRFAEVLSLSPIDYVLRWRMTLAGRSLRMTGLKIAQIAHELGYQSEAAFGAAFKRVHGVSPGKYRSEVSGSPRS